MPNFLHNVRFALKGWQVFFRHERNGKIQLVVALLAVGAGCWLHISAMEWCMVLGCIALVLSLEMVNTAIEQVCNLISKDYHPVIKQVKDISAGAVLWASVLSAITGVLIFGKHLWHMFTS
jgi:undecaprenol kinase/diacylglycerol kinase (ATP)